MSSWFQVLSGMFSVLRIGIDNSWKEITRKEAHRIDNRWCFFVALPPHYSGGNDLYWMSIKEVIVFDVDKEITLRDYPLFHSPHGLFPKYLWMGNRLSCIEHGHEMEPFVCMGACGPGIDIMSVVFRFWINDQIIFRFSLHQDRIGNIFSGIKRIHFGYNVKTRQLTKIKDIDEGNIEVWLHTNNLVSLPSTPA
ncbi:hypothetical protein MtrunA17_Chr8g0346821 [Medicago truncatula]|uniref:Uncharacterized protein n=1 Tax=Medicago truncatula TaxID=3880 RepID=A0A396GHU5_MEDTR|nr:hypothetical protein MtrunA17_Chr8g0346821 [Medicago truncatula]